MMAGMAFHAPKLRSTDDLRVFHRPAVDSDIPKGYPIDPFGRGFAPAEISERISEVVHGYSHGPSVRGASGAPRTFLLDGPRRKRARKSPLVSRGGRRARPPGGHSPLPVGRRGDGRS